MRGSPRYSDSSGSSWPPGAPFSEMRSVQSCRVCARSDLIASWMYGAMPRVGIRTSTAGGCSLTRRGCLTGAAGGAGARAPPVRRPRGGRGAALTARGVPPRAPPHPEDRVASDSIARNTFFATVNGVLSAAIAVVLTLYLIRALDPHG